MDSLASGSPETIALISMKLDQRSAALSELSHGDLLAQMWAETIVISMTDLMRCLLATSRAIDDKKVAKYWGAAADRAQRRVDRISASFYQHLKQQKMFARKK